MNAEVELSIIDICKKCKNCKLDHKDLIRTLVYFGEDANKSFQNYMSTIIDTTIEDGYVFNRHRIQTVRDMLSTTTVLASMFNRYKELKYSYSLTYKNGEYETIIGRKEDMNEDEPYSYMQNIKVGFRVAHPMEVGTFPEIYIEYEYLGKKEQILICLGNIVEIVMPHPVDVNSEIVQIKISFDKSYGFKDIDKIYSVE